MTPSTPDSQALDALKDIHLPPPVGVWPPAPGWYVLAILTLVLFGLLVWWSRRMMERRRFRRRVHASLPQLPTQKEGDSRFFAQLNAALKRYARSQHPRTPVATLSGDDWVDFMANQAPQLPRTDLERLSASSIQPNPSMSPEEALELAQQWLRSQGC